MLRKKVRNLLTNKEHRPRLKTFCRLLILVGLLWLISFPYMSRMVFTSENALNGRAMFTEFGKDASVYAIYKRIERDLREYAEVKDLKIRRQNMKKYIIGELSTKFEVHEQDKYVYTYLRAEGGYGNECNILTFPLNYEASVTVALAFLAEWH